MKNSDIIEAIADMNCSDLRAGRTGPRVGGY
jgi:hypothetical protein